MSDRSIPLMDIHQMLKEGHAKAQQAYDHVWSVFMMNYMGTEKTLSPLLLRDIYPWYEQADKLNKLFAQTLTQQHPGQPLSPVAVTFLDRVYAITPKGVAHIVERITPAKDVYALDSALTEEQAHALHMVKGSLSVLNGAGKRVNYNSYTPDDAAALSEENFVQLFAYLGEYLRQTEDATSAA